MDGISRSPIQAHFQQSLSGLAVIRALKQEQVFIDHCDNLLDSNHRVLQGLISSTRWLGVRLDLLCAVYVLVTGLLIYAFIDEISGGFAAVALLWALNTCLSFNFMCVFMLLPLANSCTMLSAINFLHAHFKI